MESMAPGDSRLVDELWISLSPREVQELYDHLAAWLTNDRKIRTGTSTSPTRSHAVSTSR